MKTRREIVTLPIWGEPDGGVDSSHVRPIAWFRADWFSDCREATSPPPRRAVAEENRNDKRADSRW